MTLRELRERKNLTQTELAALADCEQTQISQYERGLIREPRYGMVVRLAEALGVSPDTVARAIRQTAEAEA